MRSKEFVSANALKTYVIKLRLPGPGAVTITDTTVLARTPEMARRIIDKQFGSKIRIGQPRLLK